jgi:hypothetical protein
VIAIASGGVTARSSCHCGLDPQSSAAELGENRPLMTPQEFVQKWGPGGPAFYLNEEQGAQSHFLDLCEVLDVPKPGSQADYLFEEQGDVIGGRKGYADVYMRDHFAWENKAPGKSLDVALKQLLTYSLALDNPPLLVVCDRLTIRIHTQFNGHPSETHEITLAQIEQPEKQAILRRLWTDPESFRPHKTTRDITELAARSFANLAEQLRKRGNDAEEVAHFLTQCLFCFFAEDVGLLPGRMFERLVNNRQITSDRLTTGLRDLFTVMRDGGLYGPDDIPWFNGGLFKKIAVPKLEILDVTELRNAAALNWSAIDVSIFGTLFERGLDPSKRSQLGAHYTDPATIMRLIDPVVQRPLLEEWKKAASEIAAAMEKSKKRGDRAHKAAQTVFVEWLHKLEAYRILDPACGSGNFLFLGLKTLKDIEHRSHLEAATMGLDRQQDLVTGPHNVLGIELNEYAAELARVTVWIGELQWRLEHGYSFKTNPVLEPLDHIECSDALIAHGDSPFGVSGKTWPRATVAIGNPPFLGNKKMRSELGDEYVTVLRREFEGRVPGGADLVCYWFEKCRAQIAIGHLERAGLVATNSIRGGQNREVLTQISESTRIFDAWSDVSWVNEGAAVRVSLVAFGQTPNVANLDGKSVGKIAPDLTAASSDSINVDLTTAIRLKSNAGACFMGITKVGPFDIERARAVSWLALPNVGGVGNQAVLRPSWNGIDVTRRPRDVWIIDFGVTMSENAAALFEEPFKYAQFTIKPFRQTNNREAYRTNWWRHGEARPGLRKLLSPLFRFIATPEVAKHRVFVWLHGAVLPDKNLQVTPRSDDTTFGMLQSRFHEVWSLRMCSWLGVGNDPRYTPTSCFETFPFPSGLVPADTANQETAVLDGGALIPGQLHAETLRAAAETIAIAAKRLNDLRESWINPPEWTNRVPEAVPLGMDKSPYPDRILPKPGHEKVLAARTLTNLYNQRPAWLDAAHKALDVAVAAAYGWTDYTPEMSDEEILRRLLALNLERAKAERERAV